MEIRYSKAALKPFKAMINICGRGYETRLKVGFDPPLGDIKALPERKVFIDFASGSSECYLI